MVFLLLLHFNVCYVFLPFLLCLFSHWACPHIHHCSPQLCSGPSDFTLDLGLSKCTDPFLEATASLALAEQTRLSLPPKPCLPVLDALFLPPFPVFPSVPVSRFLSHFLPWAEQRSTVSCTVLETQSRAGDTEPPTFQTVRPDDY